MAMTVSSFAQSVSPTSTFSATSGGSGSAWNFNSSTRLWTSNVSNGNQSEFLFSNTFDLTNLPSNVTLSSISLTFTRSASGSNIVDSAVRLRIGNNVLYGIGTELASATIATAATNTWTTTATSTTYTFNSSWLRLLNTNALKSSGLSMAVRVVNNSSSNRTVTLGSSVSMTVTWLTLAPIILSDLSVSKNKDNHADIRFATSSEENVKWIYVERSANGRDYQTLFTIAPKGARNVYTKYNVVDKTPLQGNNYYRLAELDKDGNMHYYITRSLNFSTVSGSFNAYYNGSQIVANISNVPGSYEVSVIDMSGVNYGRKQVNMTGRSVQLNLDAPSRAGIYLVILKGHGVAESTKIAVIK